jgi:hypothetical protein
VVAGAILLPRNVLEWRCDPASRWRHPAITSRDQHLILICQEGFQSSLAAAILQRLGLAHATDLDAASTPGPRRTPGGAGPLRASENRAAASDSDLLRATAEATALPPAGLRHPAHFTTYSSCGRGTHAQAGRRCSDTEAAIRAAERIGSVTLCAEWASEFVEQRRAAASVLRCGRVPYLAAAGWHGRRTCGPTSGADIPRPAAPPAFYGFGCRASSCNHEADVPPGCSAPPLPGCQLRSLRVTTPRGRPW